MKTAVTDLINAPTRHTKRLLLTCWVVCVWCASVGVSCAPPLRSTLAGPPIPQQLAEFWIDPHSTEQRNLYDGPGGGDLAPTSGSTFTFKHRDTTGHSPGYDVVDEQGLEWSVKLGKEAQTEVVASRILWAIGYHQPPTYHLSDWMLSGAGAETGRKGSARFRPELPGARVVDDWSWHENPFVGTRAYRGLVIANMLMNNWDMKTAQNKIYEFDRPANGIRRWYVVRDLGASFGKPRWPTGTKNDVEHFEKHGFIREVRNGHFRFHYHGRHSELFRDLTAADMRWICLRLSELTDDQWSDAFRAGGYDEETAARYIRRLRQKIAEGLAASGGALAALSRICDRERTAEH
jgi:hypothetical protein